MFVPTMLYTYYSKHTDKVMERADAECNPILIQIHTVHKIHEQISYVLYTVINVGFVSSSSSRVGRGGLAVLEVQCI